MDIQQIKYFSRVYEMRSFTQAADSAVHFAAGIAQVGGAVGTGDGGAAVREPG